MHVFGGQLLTSGVVSQRPSMVGLQNYFYVRECFACVPVGVSQVCSVHRAQKRVSAPTGIRVVGGC